MSGSSELLVLRLALLAVVFAFVIVAAWMLRSGLRPRAAVRQPAVSTAAGQARLVMITAARTGVERGAVFQVAGEATIGRDAGNSVVFADASVSGRHAVLRRGRQWNLADLGSTNGTLVNGRPVDGRGSTVKDGDQLTFGTVVVRFELPQT